MPVFLNDNEINICMINGKRIKRMVLNEKCIMDGTETRVPYDVEDYEYEDDGYNSIILTKYIGEDEDVSTSLTI